MAAISTEWKVAQPYATPPGFGSKLIGGGACDPPVRNCPAADIASARAALIASRYCACEFETAPENSFRTTDLNFAVCGISHACTPASHHDK
jgi:hypothetical protein